MSIANVAVWGVVGAAMGAYDGYKYAKKKKLKGAKKAAAIVGGAVLGAVNPFKVVKAVKTGYKAYKASKYTKKAVSTTKKAKTTKKVASKPKQPVTASKSAQQNFKKAVANKNKQIVATEKKTVDNPKCFVAGTKIHTDKGFVDIEKIKPGDYVWSENPETKEKALKKVKKIFVREKDSIIRLSVNGEAIETTHEHPFYVEGEGFVGAGYLEAGDELRLESGEEAFVETIEEIQLDQPIKVYNFEVEDYHTYYVSEQKVLVHNTCAETTKNLSVHVGKSGEQVYVVGAYKDVKGVIEGMDAHHVGQKALMKRLVENYNADIAPSISVPKIGHTIAGEYGVVSRTSKGILTARQLLARDIREIRRVYRDVPNSALKALIDMNKGMYPEMRR